LAEPPGNKKSIENQCFFILDAGGRQNLEHFGIGLKVAIPYNHPKIGD
jgi:hypothetical protein